MTILNAIIQGIVQGLTEFLPISSSGHLLLAQNILGIHENNLFFNVMLHLGTLIAVCTVYWKLIVRLIVASFQMIGSIFKGNFKFKNLKKDEKLVLYLITAFLPLFLLFLPIPILNIKLKDVVETLANSNNLLVVGLALITTSILLYFGVIKKSQRFEKVSEFKKSKKLSFSGALKIGFAQLVAAIFPGLSRSGTTLSVGMLSGLEKQTTLDFSFVLSIPTILAAALVEFKEIGKFQGSQKIDTLPLLIGMIVSAVVGLVSIKIFKWMLKADKMYIFAIYTLVIGIVAVICGVVS